jgi:hypothetical protein
MLKLFHVLDLPKSGVVVMQLFVCGCVSYSWSAMLCHSLGSLTEGQQIIFQKCWTTPEEAVKMSFDMHILIGKLLIPSSD